MIRSADTDGRRGRFLARGPKIDDGLIVVECLIDRQPPRSEQDEAKQPGDGGQIELRAAEDATIGLDPGDGTDRDQRQAGRSQPGEVPRRSGARLSGSLARTSGGLVLTGEGRR